MTTKNPVSTNEIAKPTCGKCGVAMWLFHIDPQLSCDRLTFECARCGAQEHREVAPGRFTRSGAPVK